MNTNSFFPGYVKSWNDIGDDIRNSESLIKYKAKLFSLVSRTKEDIVGIHSPIGIKDIYRLGLGLGHKARHNFLYTPSDLSQCQHDPVLRLHSSHDPVLRLHSSHHRRAVAILAIDFPSPVTSCQQGREDTFLLPSRMQYD